MGVFGKFKELIGIEEIEEEDDYEEEPVVEKKPETRQNSFVQPAPAKEVKDNRVVSMQNNNNSSVNRITSQFKMVVIEPKSFDESPKLVDNLKAKKPVIINLEKLESDTARKIFDFLSGATYALNGNVQKIANNIFVFVPENVDVTSSVDQKTSANFGEMKNPWR